jgi:UDP-N-acetylmuramoylalanine--D-glutamate ligase
MISSPGARIIAIKNTTSSSDSIDVFCTRMDNLQIEDHFTIEKSCLDGHHNQVNIAAASVSARHSGIAEQIIRAQWNAKSSAYIHLPHRLEDVCKGAVLQASQGERKQVRAINDSKATNVESTIVALKSFNTPVRLLLGGEPKGDLYSDILPFVGKNVCMVYPFGKAAPLICEQLKKAAQYLAEPSSKMTDAAEKALDDALNGDIILLSPACASFDEFRNFEHRGDVFKDWVASKAVR